MFSSAVVETGGGDWNGDAEEGSAFDQQPEIPDDLVPPDSNAVVFEPFMEEPFEPEEDGEGDWDDDKDA